MNFVLTTEHFLAIKHQFFFKLFAIFVYGLQYCISFCLKLFPFRYWFLKLTGFWGYKFVVEVIGWFFDFFFENCVGLFQLFLARNQFSVDFFVVVLGFGILIYFREHFISGIFSWILLYFFQFLIKLDFKLWHLIHGCHEFPQKLLELIGCLKAISCLGFDLLIDDPSHSL